MSAAPVPSKNFLRRSAPFFTTLLLAAICALFILPIRSQPDVTAVSASRLERLGKALLKYAEQREGNLPRHLRELSPRDFEPSEEPARIANFIDPESELELEWMYIPHGNLRTVSPESVLIASPSAIPHQNEERVHLVLRRDGVVAYMPEEQFFRMVEKQVRADGK